MKLLFLLIINFLISVSAIADPQIKIGQLGLNPNQVATDLKVGDEVILDILVSEKIGDEKTAWSLDTNITERWVPYGDLSVDRQSLQNIESGALTKIKLKAMLMGSGNVAVEKLRLIDQDRKYAIEASGNIATKVATTLSEEDKKQAHWILNPVAIGGWDSLRLALLGLLFAILAMGAAWLVYKMVKKSRKVKQKNPKELALARIEELQYFVRGGGSRNREDWKRFSYGIAHTLRKFCEDLYHFPTSDRTDKELIQALDAHMDQKKYLHTLKAILNALDAARYGQEEANISIATTLLVDTKIFIEELYSHELAKINIAIAEKNK